MNKKQRATLEAIFSKPVPQNIRWADVEALVTSLGGLVEEREGSRVALRLKDAVGVFHRPHSQNTDRNAVRSVRDFLERAGVEV